MFLNKLGNDAIRGCPRAENDDPDDITAVMSHSNTLTTNVPLLIGGESTTPVNFAATAGTDIPGECMQYQKEKSRLKRVNFKLRAEIKVGRSCTSVITIIIFIQLVFMGSSYSTGIGITISRRKMVKL